MLASTADLSGVLWILAALQLAANSAGSAAEPADPLPRAEPDDQRTPAGEMVEGELRVELDAVRVRPDTASALALVGVTLVDPARDVHAPGMTVLIEGERIRDVFPTGARRLPENTEELDLSDKYLIPGLINTHVHFTNFTAPVYTDDDVSTGWERAYRELERMIYGGVTAVRDVGNDFRVMASMERDLAMGRYPGPDLYHATVLAGPTFFDSDPRGQVAVPEFWPRRTVHTGEVAEDADIRALVAGAAARGAMGLKLYMHLDAARIKELTREAHRQGLKVLSHATVYPDRPIDVIRAGVNSVSHASHLVWQAEALDPSENVPFVHTAGRSRIDPDLVDPAAPEFDALFAEMAERGVILDATTSMLMGGLGAPFGYTPELVVELMRAAHRAGVLISTGTDYFADTEVSFLGIDYDVDLLSQPWPAVFQEIEHLVVDGIMTPAEAITAATLNGARAIGIEDTHGTIEPGKAASLVILEEDPTEDIRALRTVSKVFKRGALYPRSDYEAMGAGQQQDDARRTTAQSQSLDDGAVEEELVQLNRELLEQYMLHHDTEPYEHVALDDYLFLAGIGIIETKEEVISTVGNLDIDSVTITNEEFRRYGPTAVLVGRLDVDGRVLGTQLPAQIRYMSVFVEHEGEWRLLSRAHAWVRDPRALMQRE